MSAMRDREMAAKIREKEPSDLEAAFRHAMRLEAFKKADAEQNAQPHSTDQPIYPRGRNRRDDGLNRRVEQLEHMTAATMSAGSQQLPSPPNAEMDDMRRKIDNMSREMGRLQALQAAAKVPAAAPPLPGGWTPTANSNAAPVNAYGRDRSTPAKSRDWSQATCYNCGVKGHGYRFCTAPKQQRQNSDQPVNTNGTAKQVDPPVVGASRGTIVTQEKQAERRVYLRLVVNGCQRKALLDTGSDVTLLPTFAVSGVPVKECVCKISAANGTPIRIRGTATVEAQAGDHTFQLTGLVTDHVNEVMLGFDFLDSHDATWHFRTGEINLDGYVHKLHNGGPATWCRRVVLQDTCIVPARTEANILTKVVYNDLARIYGEDQPRWSTDTRVLRSGLRVPRVLLPDGDVDVPIRVLNTAEHPVTIPAGTVVSPIEPVEVCTDKPDDANQSVNMDDDPVLVEMVDRVDESVTADERRQLM
ncbi:MAG TPA: hypothetical protein VLS45_08230, partial [Methylomicrobium sp.]|nr:hypothetical protein [Methylomicrobium sp.]